MIAEMTGQTVAAWPDPYRIAGEAYGVQLLIGTDSPILLGRLEELLPPGWVRREAEQQVSQDTGGDTPHFTLTTPDGLDYVVRRDGELLARSRLDVALGAFDAHLRGYIARHSPSRLFVHAGVVGYNGRAIVIPGPTYSGKTTLVAKLIRAGAVYYSDEYAVLDDRGLVHPYPKPLSIRDARGLATDHRAGTLGGMVGEKPLPIGLLVVTHYRSGARWEPRKLSPGEAILALFANTVPVQERPAATMAALRRVLDGFGAMALESDRGEAAAIVDELLRSVPA
jgi:hypothetical protein